MIVWAIEKSDVEFISPSFIHELTKLAFACALLTLKNKTITHKIVANLLISIS